jgi:hypothetical protein
MSKQLLVVGQSSDWGRFIGDNHLEHVLPSTLILQPGDILIAAEVGRLGHPNDGPGAAGVIYDDESGSIEMMRIQGHFWPLFTYEYLRFCLRLPGL